MICPKCSTINENSNVFCVNCGETLTSNSNLPQTMLPPNAPETMLPTQVFQAPQNPNPNYSPAPPVSAPSQNYNQSQPDFNPSQANFNPSIPYTPPPAPPKNRAGLWIGLGFLAVLLLGGGIIGTIFLLNRPAATPEALPDHLGMFVQNAEKTSVEELRKQDFTNALEGKDKILKDESMPAAESRPNVILYSDGKDIPFNDLRLIQLDSVKTDGTLKQLDFRVTPVEGKPEMKRLWVGENLAKGKYAFAILDGSFDDGKHKFWVFQVKNSDRTDNANLAKEVSVTLKNKSNSSPSSNSNTSANTDITKVTPTPKPTVAPPVGSRTAYAATNNVVVRSSPSLTGSKVSGLRRGQKVYVVGASNNYDYWNGLEGNWLNIQTESGQRGWVFSPLVNY